MKLVFVLIALAALLVGCDTKKALEPQPSSQSVSALSVGQSWVDGNGTTWTRLDAIHLQSVTIGKLKVVYVCDWDGIGPPSPGHCFTDGTGCVDPLLEP